MSKNDWYGGYGFIPAKDNFEDMLFKKQELQKKFINMCAKKKSEQSKSVKSSCFELEELHNNQSSIEKEQKKALDSLRKDISKYKNDIADLKKELSKVKKIRFENLNKINSQSEEIDLLKSELNKVYQLLEEEQEKNRSLKKELDKQLNSEDKKELKRVKIENSKLIKSNRILSNNLASVNKQLQNYQLIRTGELESNLVSKYKDKIIQQDNEIDNLKVKLYTTHNVINNLNAKIYNKRKSIVARKTVEYKKAIANSVQTASSKFNDNIIFGFLSLNKDHEIIFIDINNRRYKISKNNNTERLMNHIGMPVRAVKNDKDVFVDYIYYTVAKSDKCKVIKSNKIKINKDKLKTLSLNTKEFVGKKVLIIGSKKKGYYNSALSRLGAEVVYHESFSDNETRLLEIAPSCDVVIVCTSHVSHSVMYELKNIKDYSEDNIKYQMVKQDNVQNLVHRIRYVLENINEKVCDKVS